MGIFVTKLIFNVPAESFARGSAGWSETYFINATDYSTAATTLDGLRAARLPTLTPEVSLVGGFISDTAVKGDSFPVSFAVPEPGTYAPTGAPKSYNPDVALRVLYVAGTAKRGSRWVRCIPQDNVDAQGDFAPVAGFTTVLNNYLNQIASVVSLASKIKGAVTPPFYTLSTYTGFTKIGMESRKIGRPFSGRRGRRLIA